VGSTDGGDALDALVAGAGAASGSGGVLHVPVTGRSSPSGAVVAAGKVGTRPGSRGGGGDVTASGLAGAGSLIVQAGTSPGEGSR